MDLDDFNINYMILVLFVTLICRIIQVYEKVICDEIVSNSEIYEIAHAINCHDTPQIWKIYERISRSDDRDLELKGIKEKIFKLNADIKGISPKVCVYRGVMLAGTILTFQG